MKRYLAPIALFAAAMILVAPGDTLAQKKTPAKAADGRVSIEETQFAIILGGSTGGGRLSFKDRIYNFKVGGLTAGANVGISKVSAVGEVFNLKDISKFPGTYTQLDASVTAGGGVGAMHLKNEHGVVMTLTSRSGGLQLNLGSASGVKVTME